jgi:hypothetical protein
VFTTEHLNNHTPVHQTVAVGRLQEILDAIGIKTAVTLTA